MKEYKNYIINIDTFFLKIINFGLPLCSLRKNPIHLQRLNQVCAFALLYLFLLVLLISNIQPAFSADERKPLSESETKNYLEQLENLDSAFLIKKEGLKNSMLSFII